MKKLTVLTTSPSIDINTNVGGVSNMTRLWIENNKQVNYIHFIAGKNDLKSRGILWFLGQLTVVVHFFSKMLFEKNVNIVHINMPLVRFAILREYVFILIASFFQKPIVVHIRGGNYNLKKSPPKYIRFFIKSSLKMADRIIVLGKKESLFYSKEYSVNLHKILVLPNAVKIDKTNIFYANNRKYVKKCLNILFLGRLDKNKGLEEIVKGLSSATFEYKLLIAGDGLDRDWFLTLCARKIANRYEYLGVVSGSRKIDLFINSDLFLLPSYHEGLPNSLLEAMSYGIVPIVTPVGSIPDVILNNYNGIFVPIKDFKEIRKAIKIISQNPDLYAELSKNAYKTIIKKFSLTSYLVSINKLYKDLFMECN